MRQTSFDLELGVMQLQHKTNESLWNNRHALRVRRTVPESPGRHSLWGVGHSSAKSPAGNTEIACSYFGAPVPRIPALRPGGCWNPQHSFVYGPWRRSDPSVFRRGREV